MARQLIYSFGLSPCKTAEDLLQSSLEMKVKTLTSSFMTVVICQRLGNLDFKDRFDKRPHRFTFDVRRCLYMKRHISNISQASTIETYSW